MKEASTCFDFQEEKISNLNKEFGHPAKIVLMQIEKIGSEKKIHEIRIENRIGDGG